MARTSVWFRLKLWPGRLCDEDSSCGQDVCVMRTQVMARTSVWYGVDSSCGLVVKPRGYLSCIHVTPTLVCHVRWSALPAHT